MKLITMNIFIFVGIIIKRINSELLNYFLITFPDKNNPIVRKTNLTRKWNSTAFFDSSNASLLKRKKKTQRKSASLFFKSSNHENI